MANTIRFQNGPTFTFLAVLSSEGVPLNQPRLVEEVLEAAGVNGRRWRSIHRQFPVLEVRTLAEAATFTAAEILARSYLSARLTSQTVIMNLDAGGKAFSFPTMHCSGIDPVPQAGQVSGPAAGASSLAHVRALWRLEFPA